MRLALETTCTASLTAKPQIPRIPFKKRSLSPKGASYFSEELRPSLLARPALYMSNHCGVYGVGPCCKYLLMRPKFLS